MHQRYGWQMILNEPDLKSFCLKSSEDLDHDTWVTLYHNLDDLYLKLNSDVNLKNQYKYKNFFGKIKHKMVLCWKIIKGEKLTYEYEYVFKGRNEIENFSDMLLLLSKEVKQETNLLNQYRQQLQK